MTKARCIGTLVALLASACTRSAEHAPPKTGISTPRADATPARLTATRVATTHNHTCAVFSDGSVRCWGVGAQGQLGAGNTNSYGDDEPPALVDLGGAATDVDVGARHSCALMASGSVRCWGDNAHGQLGYGHRNTIGDDETPSQAGDVPLDEPAVAVSLENDTSCALLKSGAVRCWGKNSHGQAGIGADTRSDIGDDEPVVSKPPIRFARRVMQLRTPCALFDDGSTVCWWPNEDDHDDIATLASRRPPLDLGGKVRRLSRSCFMLADGGAICKSGAAFGNLPLRPDGRVLVRENPDPEIIDGRSHSCGLYADGTVGCWGSDSRPGVVGVPGAEKSPDYGVRKVDVGEPATALVVGTAHSCVITRSGGVRCWGVGHFGALGYGTTENVGELRAPAQVGDVPF
jgi:alpha-tubulin suppressor-like RCC1 family protein